MHVSMLVAVIHQFSKYFLSDSDNTHRSAQVTQSSGIIFDCSLGFPLDSLKVTYLVAVVLECRNSLEKSLLHKIKSNFTAWLLRSSLPFVYSLQMRACRYTVFKFGLRVAFKTKPTSFSFGWKKTHFRFCSEMHNLQFCSEGPLEDK